MNAEDLHESEVEIHRVGAPPSISPSRHRKHAARPEDEESEQQQHDVKIALRYAAEELESVFKTADDEPGDDGTRDAAESSNHGDDQPLDGQRQRKQRR